MNLAECPNTKYAPDVRFWVSPVSADEVDGPLVIKRMITHVPPYFCWRTKTKGKVKPSDMLCIYATRQGGGTGGVVAHARVASEEQDDLNRAQLLLSGKATKQDPILQIMDELQQTNDVAALEHMRLFPRIFLLADVTSYSAPVALAPVFAQLHDHRLEARNPGQFASATREICEHDFLVLTGHADPVG
jgi:hypothetical protein